jgi:hypothetical protein
MLYNTDKEKDHLNYNIYSVLKNLIGTLFSYIRLLFMSNMILFNNNEAHNINENI